uniref:Uncharacterized protein n=2 Tax=Cacopsylla melanoneura TaxID=428564 RepID=A0A8D8S378_9HEMI
MSGMTVSSSYAIADTSVYSLNKSNGLGFSKSSINHSGYQWSILSKLTNYEVIVVYKKFHFVQKSFSVSVSWLTYTSKRLFFHFIFQVPTIIFVPCSSFVLDFTMNPLVLISLLCVFQCVRSDDTTSAETTTTSGETADTTLSTGPVDLDAFDADLNSVYESIAKIKSKASKLEMIGPKIQDAMRHLEGDEEDVAKNLQAKYQQILPLLQKLKLDDSQKTQKAANRRRRKRFVSVDFSSTVASTNTETGNTETTNAETGNTETTLTGSTDAVSDTITTDTVTTGSPADTTTDSSATTLNAESSSTASSTTAPSSNTSAI